MKYRVKDNEKNEWLYPGTQSMHGGSCCDEYEVEYHALQSNDNLIIEVHYYNCHHDAHIMRTFKGYIEQLEAN